MYSVFLGYCTPHISLLLKLNSFFSLALFYLGIHNGKEKNLTMYIKRFFRGVIYLFATNDIWNIFQETIDIVICVILTHCVQKSIYDSPFIWLIYLTWTALCSKHRISQILVIQKSFNFLWLWISCMLDLC